MDGTVGKKIEEVTPWIAPKEKWEPSITTVKAVTKFAIATKKAQPQSESEAEESVDEQRKEMDGRAA